MRNTLIFVLIVIAGIMIGRIASRSLIVETPRFNERHQIDWPELHLTDVTDSIYAEPLRSLHAGEKQIGIDGQLHSITAPKDISGTGVMLNDGKLLYGICRAKKPKETLEIGFARGVSTLYILAALQANGFGRHTAIDPFERTDWHGIGLMMVERTHNHDRFRFIESRSIEAIPELAGRKYDFIFIDGSHLFDDALVDFELSALYCSEQCIIAIHDAEYLQAVGKAIRFIENNRPDYVRIRSPLGSTAIFRRVGPDKRAWNHFADF